MGFPGSAALQCALSGSQVGACLPYSSGRCWGRKGINWEVPKLPGEIIFSLE